MLAGGIKVTERRQLRGFFEAIRWSIPKLTPVTPRYMLSALQLNNGALEATGRWANEAASTSVICSREPVVLQACIGRREGPDDDDDVDDEDKEEGEEGGGEEKKEKETKKQQQAPSIHGKCT